MVFITNYLVDICKSRYGHPLNILFIKETRIACCVSWYLCFGRDESPWLSCVSPCLRSEGTDCFSSRLTFKSICIAHSIGRQSHMPSLRAKNWHTMLYSVIRTVSPSRARGQESLLPIMKYSSSLNSGFFSYNAIRHVCRFHRALFFSPCGYWGSWNKKMLILHSFCSCREQWSPFLGPKRPVSFATIMKLWHANLLFANRVKSETLHSSWSLFSSFKKLLTNRKVDRST